MKIAVTASSPNLESNIDPRFGRCQYFICVDPDTLQFEAIENPGAMAGGGAGIATAQAIAGKKVEAVLTGNCGPNAHQVLTAAGIRVITGVSGEVQEAIQDYQAGKYTASSQPNVIEHFGMGQSMSGSGGKGRGMGHGRGTDRS
jgi:predicted Fe-Mo cluster-binding NifX family protein